MSLQGEKRILLGMKFQELFQCAWTASRFWIIFIVVVSVPTASSEGSTPAGGLFNGAWGIGGKTREIPPASVTPEIEHDVHGKDEDHRWYDTVRDVFSRIETPGITWNLKPKRTILKIRKRLYPLGITRLTLGADFDPMLGSWRRSVKTSWRDLVIGGNINIQGSEIAITKDFNVDERTSLWLKAGFDWQTKKSMIGFKIRPNPGLSARMYSESGPMLQMRKRVPLHENFHVEFDSLPDAAYTSTSGGKLSLGLGDFKVDMRELNAVIEL
ncbi:hypothetical protein GUITHDRAFT_143685 [Guillardia theta CCMP2712]|uniref:Uncharacterized protein n=1 Tax=Guillardia theta (strain CCMP2712) TaxID=905079 RepID=L1ISR6_GUITC|nr:hypothetical protein GUITHDRAFT_143685 [Guillardia theta CCMP2712]EKX39286.1 hypothetical protein GUITHDRAFT_143685 [Guillardia theta CCMP2712]|eukprot:XP_005826266.1 hypothetical protein GUITHDRAFT_143685 [Guillardia theta CCMP2712]